MAIVESTIKSIDLIKGEIIINKLNDKQKKDFICKKEFYIKYLEVSQLDTLKEGDSVSFIAIEKAGNYYANNIKLIQSNEAAIMPNVKCERSILMFTNKFIKELESTLASISSSEDFEDFTLFVLKSLGISEIYAVPRNNAAGRADGVFKVSNISNNTPKLEVIYDCTLYSGWEEKKKQQIANYVTQICRNSMNIDYEFIERYITKKIKTSISFNNNSEKQIWIITKNATRTISEEQLENSESDLLVKVREINISDLIKLLAKKLLDTKYIKIDDIANELKNL
ncbi:hypothetical protein A6046_02110 [[Haemophilus] ducreyi]|nr:hypothetical protein [[Haemophilus] ducreyi]AKO32105.1 hypothetical protein RZ57_02625 [[Haemophilus] ducreyi]AKO33561.1 hypothetical protein RZ58_02630 [[Haemophilus] ducreyi]AKO36439.1 hypothetical protein RZ61_02645 [[Haemophilus] ducreyi]AKO39446.1 hypothetical protein RZ63_02660 [[Haemophilus] ducreyi]AKO42391.1 hypothetical protein RZ65_02630 [[Haemophilus] ducreyi]